MIVRLGLGIAYAYLLKGAHPILIDTGCPGQTKRLTEGLQRASVAAADLALILHTHAHWDHAGGTSELRHLTRAPTAVHEADAEMLRRGDNGILRPTGRAGRLLRPFLDRRYPGLAADIVFAQLDLAPYGAMARVIATPGHTAGSISVLTADGDAVVGDLLMGGYLGGKLWRRRPTLHYFAEDLATLRNSVVRLLAERPRRIWPGHGGPLYPEDVARAFAV